MKIYFYNNILELYSLEHINAIMTYLIKQSITYKYVTWNIPQFYSEIGNADSMVSENLYTNVSVCLLNTWINVTETRLP